MAGKRIALLYVGKTNDDAPVAYPEYTKEDILALGNATEFVIIPGTYRGYLNDKTVNNTKGIEFSEVSKDMATLATRIKNWTGKHVWLGLPDTPAPKDVITLKEYKEYATKLINCANELKERVNIWMGGSQYFDTYVEGFYMCREHILVPGDEEKGKPVYGVTLTASNPTAHPQVAMMNIVSNHVHNTLKKKMMWIPYYGVGGNWNNTIYSIGVVANKTNIYDYVFLQPSYYFNPGTSNGVDVNVDNLYAVRESITLNKVVGRPSAYSVVTGNKTSNTKIGAEMEMDMHYTESGCSTRFAKYVDCFNNTGSLTSKSKHSDYKKGNYDFAFYFDAKRYNYAERAKEVNKFFET